VRIEDYLNDREKPAGLEGTELSGESDGAIGNLPEDSDQDHAIKVIGGELAVGCKPLLCGLGRIDGSKAKHDVTQQPGNQ